MRIVDATDDEIGVVLTKNEVAALLTVFGNVGGSPYESGRKYIDSINIELDRFGFGRDVRLMTESSVSHTNSIYFADQPELIKVLDKRS